MSIKRVENKYVFNKKSKQKVINGILTKDLEKFMKRGK